MTASVTHSKTSTVPPTADAGLVSSTDWNAGHVISISAADVGADPTGTASSAVSTHEAASDPHTGYLKESVVAGISDSTSTTSSTTAASATAVKAAKDAADAKPSLTANTPSTQASGDAAAVGSGTAAAKDDHKHAFPVLYIPVTFSKQGVVAVTTEGDSPPPFRWYNDTGRTLTFAAVRATATIGPSGSTITVDVNVDGTTIMTGTKVVLPDNTGAASTVKQTTFSTTTVADGHYVSVNVDTAGGGAAQNLSVTVLLKG